MKTIVFFRNDDVDKLDKTIIKLTELFIKLDIPISYQVIPDKVKKGFVNYFWKIKNKYLFDIGQHGFKHKNYKVDGKYMGEFGVNRIKKEKIRDILVGQKILRKKFGKYFIKVFTPPWNGNDKETFDILTKEKYIAFSRKYGLIDEGFIKNYRSKIKGIIRNIINPKKDNLIDLSCCIDLMKDWDTYTAKTTDELINEFKLAKERRNTIGVMLHDKIMDYKAFISLEKFILFLKSKNVIFKNFGAIIKNYK